MDITVTIDTSNAGDLAALSAIAAALAGGNEAPAPTSQAPEPEHKEQAEPKPAKTTRTRKSAPPAEPESPALVEEPTAPAEAEMVEDEDDDASASQESDGGKTYTKEDAVKAASALLTKGEVARVKAALAEVGVSRVSELKPGQIRAFIEALG